GLGPGEQPRRGAGDVVTVAAVEQRDADAVRARGGEVGGAGAVDPPGRTVAALDAEGEQEPRESLLRPALGASEGRGDIGDGGPPDRSRREVEVEHRGGALESREMRLERLRVSAAEAHGLEDAVAARDREVGDVD